MTPPPDLTRARTLSQPSVPTDAFALPVRTDLADASTCGRGATEGLRAMPFSRPLADRGEDGWIEQDEHGQCGEQHA